MTTQGHPGLKLADFQKNEDFEDDGRPVVGLVVSLWAPDMSDAAVQVAHDLTANGTQAVRNAGGRPLIIDSSDEQLQASGTGWLSGVDAVVYLGGADIHPGFFSDVDLAEKLEGVDPKADKFCIDSIQKCASDDMPTLGICRGSQLLNAALGGTIHQHIDGHREVIDDAGNVAFISEPVDVVAGSRLSAVLGSQTLTVRNGHHQAVDQVAEELNAVAFARDGIVQATEHPEKSWFIGVQWHPEDEQANKKDLATLFEALVKQAGSDAVKDARFANVDTSLPR
ncbi:gamma-glutamyl-gamma-aminobutyrate hydrolase family protein [Yaniella halotolerans]|uniref:gamma-glutamyl-gamma-aminobutyrate hydrolase family protein n=1 Tax=Yaniella halotolerans TaxID=225453 RepID=UPI0003B6EF9C|nr:gamma-glutamyl-gamma-aminobutyrate hydrolase family protein [Yaniella halotolerans]